MKTQLKRQLIGLVTLFAASSSSGGIIELSEGKQTVQINPDSLEILWQKKGTQIPVNQGALTAAKLPQLAANHSKLSADSAAWTLIPSKIRVYTKLNKGELLIRFDASEIQTIQRQKPLKLTWFNLPEESTQTLYLPFNEGMRIPTNHAVWAKYLQDNYSPSNTTQDLKMPFWTAQSQPLSNKSAIPQYVNYQLVTAANNSLNFTISGSKSDMQASHSFTVLNKNEPFELLISLGSEPLSGAKRYRRWREEQGLAISLSQKLAKQPKLERLIGATHVYLFGSELLSVEDVSDWWGLKEWYFGQNDLKVTAEAEKTLKKLRKGIDRLNRYNKRVLVDSIADSLKEKIKVKAKAQDSNYIEDQYQTAQKQKEYLVRYAGQYLIANELWGQAISKGMVNNLEQAGLKKLWLGVDKWTSAFYQPQVVEQAKSAGYLIGTYDSYNTAVPPGLNDNWLTAQLPKHMRLNCAIENADGSRKKGFRGNGFYLNPACGREYVQQRIQDIIKYGRFNSLFLDVDATGMVREDYAYQNKGMNETDMLKAFNERMQWIVDKQDVVLGSEDGNSLTTAGIAFAHGMETTGFGWSDNEMYKDRQSPYFLGAWYPDHKPAYFFKNAQVKTPYKELLFAPQYKIPLYQTVFHNELNNSHHWHNDSLKFSNVQMQRDLTSMLYNTPAMVHLNRTEANSKYAPRIKALKHYQQGFMPIHQVLWDEKLEKFEWLSKNGLVQQTTFSDGSRIIANYSSRMQTVANGERIPAGSITANLSNGEKVEWASKIFRVKTPKESSSAGQIQKNRVLRLGLLNAPMK
ncbi:glycoside hydrolase [Psychromonas aquimarina]|uniref:glycoside hydrolase n=1 Tax=Psychromonas aquimarina TaxID=444919 RepID=UPI00041F7B97|nr:glycoside hydrolase [Psychromonas aquimarina]